MDQESPTPWRPAQMPTSPPTAAPGPSAGEAGPGRPAGRSRSSRARRTRLIAVAATGVAAGTALGVTVVGALGPDDTTAGTPVSQDTVDQAIQRWQDGAAAEPGLDPFGSSGQPYVDGGTSSGSTDSGRTWIVPGGSTSGRADTRTQGSPG